MRSFPVLFFFAAPLLSAQLDMARDVLVRWPGPETKAIALLTQLGAKAVVTPFSSESVAPLKAAGIVPVAEIEKFSSIAELERQVTAAREGRL